jgi:fluoroquinolone transport system ATP-binding protein
VIEVEQLRFSYAGAERPAVDGLSFAIQRGEIFGFLGPNGAGKSTTQKILIGLLRGWSGRVEVLGRPLGDWRRNLYEHVGVAFEFPNHYLKLTGLENLTYFRALYRDRTAEPAELLERVGLGRDGAMPVAQYSKGMKSRLSVARALINEPELLFLDEPTGGLDPVGARRIKALVREQQAAGRTVFLTTHDMTVAAELCDRVAFLVDGRIALVDAPRALELRYGEPRVRVETRDAETLERAEFPLAGLGDNAEFARLLRERRVERIHTLEATLEEVFVRVTGRSLA